MHVSSKRNINLTEVREVILGWLQSRLKKEEYKWAASKSNYVKEGCENWEFYTTFSAVPQHTGKEELSSTDQENKKAKEIRSGWTPGGWSLDQLGRTLMVLSLAQDRSKDDFLNLLEKTFISSDMGEAIALYQSLAILPYPDRLQKRAAEGLRSSIDSVFDAVALQNPYPADFLDEDAWNQLVLKALFVGSPLYKIYGIDQRRNAKLAEMLIDYAHERWAADRSVSPELWRPIGPFIKSSNIHNLQKVLDQPEDIQKQAALLALSESSVQDTRNIVEKHQSMQKEIEHQQITWDDIGRQHDE